MKNSILIVFLFSFAHGISQEARTIQKEIDQSLWKPFQQAFQDLDGAALNTLYAEEVLRVTPEAIDTENAFKEANLERFATNKANGTTISLNFWFDSRHTNVHTSYEVGFYKIVFLTKGEENVVYGQFHIVLKKINGKWKITQDWDTTA
ncbi:MAG: nuclear transport factor 2 family protein, partial [Bacteroidota bacterium]